MPGPANSLNITETGFQSFDGVSVFHGRTLTAGTGINISNGTGVSGNPIISLAGGGIAVEHLTGTTGGTLNPDVSNNFNLLAGTVVAGTTPVAIAGSGSTLTTNVQISQALAAADATKIGLSNFDSTSFSVAATGFVALSTTGAGKTITGNSGGALSPTANNWNILGTSTAAGTSPVNTSGSGSTLTVNVQKSQAIASTDATKVGLSNFHSSYFTVDANGFVQPTAALTTDLHTASYIVGDTADGANYSTIAAAYAAAPSNSVIYIQKGTYTENLTLDKTMIFCAFCSFYKGGGTNVAITGKATISTNISASFYGIRFNTNADVSFSITGNGAIGRFENCTFSSSDANSFSITGDATTNIYLNNCFSSSASTFTLFTSTGGLVWINNSVIQGASTFAASTNSASTIFINDSVLTVPISVTSGGIIQARNSIWGTLLTPFTDQTWITTAGTGASFINDCQIGSGTQSAISVGSGTTVECYNTVVNSSNTNAVTGAGTFKYSNVIFSGTSNLMNATTQTAAYTNLGKWKASGQPAFLAYMTTSVTDITGDGTQYTIIYDTEVFDQGSDFNLGTSTFTAPVTGRYHISFGVSLIGGTLLSGVIGRMITSNRTYRVTLPTNAAVTSTASTIGTILADMDAADTLTVSIQANDTGGKIDDVSGTTGGEVRNWLSTQLSM